MTDASAAHPPKRENIWINLLCNIVVPVVILTKLSAEDRLGPTGALLLGLSFPLGYGIYDLIVRRKVNLFSIIGVVSVSLTGGLGILKVEGLWFAVKEASIPAVFAVAVLVTLRTKRPLIREFVLNESVIDVPRLEAALTERQTRPEFEQLLRSSTWILAAGFALSAVMNFVLARMMLQSPAGTPEFTAELGRMTWVSYIVIALPQLAIMIYILVKLFGGIHRLTGLELESLMHKPPAKSKPGN